MPFLYILIKPYCDSAKPIAWSFYKDKIPLALVSQWSMVCSYLWKSSQRRDWPIEMLSGTSLQSCLDFVLEDTKAAISLKWR